MYTDVKTKKKQALTWNGDIAVLPKNSTFSVLSDGYQYTVLNFKFFNLKSFINEFIQFEDCEPLWNYSKNSYLWFFLPNNSIEVRFQQN
jgi:hypothetical protein